MTSRNARFHYSSPTKVRAMVFLPFVCLLLAMVSLPARGTTINFDDIDASAGDVILGSYQGYNWTNISVYTNTPGFPGFNNGIVSPPNAAYTAGDALGSPIISSISSSGYFNFLTVELGSGWYNGLTVTFDGLTNGTQTFAQTVTVNTQGTQLFTFNFTGITQLNIFTTATSSTTDPYGCGPSGCSQATLDDLMLTPASGPAPPPPPTNMPEPMTFALAGIGILILALRYIRFKKVALEV